jgi:hypothetical protein
VKPGLGRRYTWGGGRLGAPRARTWARTAGRAARTRRGTRARARAGAARRAGACKTRCCARQTCLTRPRTRRRVCARAARASCARSSTPTGLPSPAHSAEKHSTRWAAARARSPCGVARSRPACARARTRPRSTPMRARIRTSWPMGGPRPPLTHAGHGRHGRVRARVPRRRRGRVRAARGGRVAPRARARHRHVQRHAAAGASPRGLVAGTGAVPCARRTGVERADGTCCHGRAHGQSRSSSGLSSGTVSMLRTLADLRSALANSTLAIETVESVDVRVRVGASWRAEESRTVWPCSRRDEAGAGPALDDAAGAEATRARSRRVLVFRTALLPRSVVRPSSPLRSTPSRRRSAGAPCRACPPEARALSAMRRRWSRWRCGWRRWRMSGTGRK